MMLTELEKNQFRKAMSHFATGIAIVTGRDRNEVHGMTCNAFCSISLSPMLVLISLSQDTRTQRIIEAGRIFAVNFLNNQQSGLADRFAGRDKNCELDRFAGVDWTTAITGAPILKNSMAYVDCRVANAIALGGHVLFFGDALAAYYEERMRPLIFFQSQYMTVDRSMVV